MSKNAVSDAIKATTTELLKGDNVSSSAILIAATAAITSDIAIGGIGTAAALSYKAIFGTAKDSIPSSNHKLLKMVWQAKWESIGYLLEGSRIENKKDLLAYAVSQSKMDPSKSLDPRDLEPKEHIRRITKIRETLGYWLNPSNSSKKQNHNFSQSEVSLLQSLHKTIGRELNNQDSVDSNRKDEEIELASKLTDTVLQSLWDSGQFVSERFKGKAHEFYSYDTNTGTGQFVQNVQHPTRGWFPTYRIILKHKIDKDPELRNRIQINFVAETRTLIEGLGDGIATLTAFVQRQSNSTVDYIRELKGVLCPEIALDLPESANFQGRNKFTSYTFSSRRTKLIGRRSEWLELNDFLESGNKFSWWQISGAGGHGKSRLALELIYHALGKGWHAGFLKVNSLSAGQINWSNAPLSTDTLIVIDYVSSPEKVSAIKSAISILSRRELKARIRILVLERVGFDYSSDRSSNLEASWVSRLLERDEDDYLLSFAHAPDGDLKSLDLSPLSNENMLEIARSYLKHTGNRPLNKNEESTVLRNLKQGKRDRAWIPLFAMLFAEQIVTIKKIENDSRSKFSFEKLLKQTLSHEKETYWRGGNGEVISPIECSWNIACLATMTEFLDISDAWFKNIDVNDTFYGDLDHQSLVQTWMILGWRISSDAAGEQKLVEGRQPDIPGEYMVIDYLSRIGRNVPNQRERLIKDAADISSERFFSFLSRLIQDFPHHECTDEFTRKAFVGTQLRKKWLKTARILVSEHSNPDLLNFIISELENNYKTHTFINYFLILSSRWGNTETTQYYLDKSADANFTEKGTGNFPLLVAAQFGHTDCVLSLLKSNSNPDYKNAKTGAFPLQMAAKYGHLDVAEALLDYGAHPNQTNKGNGYSPLLSATGSGHFEIVQLLIENKADPNLANEQNGFTPLISAAGNGHLEIVQLLIENKADPNLANEQNGFTPLISAAGNGHLEIVQLLIKNKADPNLANEQNGFTPFISAAINGYLEIAQLLIENKADPNLANEQNGFTPLISAAGNGHLEIVQLLIKNKADPNLANEQNGFTPFISAAINGYLEIAQLLIENKADPNLANEQNGFTPLISAAGNGHLEIVQLLIKNKADPNLANEQNGFTPLISAAINGYLEIAQLLIENKADPNLANEQNGFTPLTSAANNGHLEIVQLLIENKADPNLANKQTGFTPLISATSKGHLEIACILIEKKADPDLANEKNGFTPLLSAVGNEHREIAKLLIQNEADPNLANKQTGFTPLISAVDHGNIEIVQLLIENKADPNLANEQNGFTPLISAAGNGHLEIVQLLIKNKADPNLANEQNGFTPLISAAGNGHLEIVQLLIKNKADPNLANEQNGFTPLISAAINGYLEIAQLLIENKADPNLANEQNGFTPLISAAGNGHLEIVQLLIKNKADPNLANEQLGFTPLISAAGNGHLRIVQLLIENNADPNYVNELDGYNPLIVACKNGFSEVVEQLLHENQVQPDITTKAKYPSPLFAATYKGHQEVIQILLNINANPNIKDASNITPLHVAAALNHYEIAKLLVVSGARSDIIGQIRDRMLTALDVALEFGHQEIVAMLKKKQLVERHRP